jgi:predicted lactoylglutathione lyase
MRFSTVALGVENLERALRFYLEGLGFAVDSRPQDDLVYLASGETRLALYPAAALADYAGVKPSPAGAVILSLNVDESAEVDEITARCLARGGATLRTPGPMSWGGYASTLRDPDGHCWEIVCPGA